MNNRQWRPGLPYSSPSLPRHNSRIGSAALISTIFDAGLPYSKRLSVHRSCVNALSFSRNGRLLASAGDDKKLFIWNFRPENLNAPDKVLTGHQANIFCLDFSVTDRYIYSGSVDQTVCKYDLGSLEQTPITRFHEQNDTIRGVSTHPENDDIFLSSSEDGTICLYDARSGSRPSGTISRRIEVADARYHPMTGTLFISADELGRVLLHDVRMAFENGRLGLGQMGVVLTYVTTPVRIPFTRPVHQHASSIALDREGKRFVVTFMNTSPTLYETSDPYPLSLLSATLLPDGSPVPQGERTYANNCTTKHGSFGGPGLPVDEYYTAGSDDFRTYVWKIPPTEELRERRKVIKKEDWSKDTSHSQIMGFTRIRDNEVYVPADICQPLFRLQGHDSIVNTSLIHPVLPHIVTAGVERHIVVHGPIGTSSQSISPEAQTNGFTKTKEEVRRLPEPGEESVRRYARAIATGHLVEDEDMDVDEEEEKTIDFFDQCIRENLDLDLFAQTRDFQSSELDFDIPTEETGSEESSDDRSEEYSDENSSDEMEIV